KLRVGMRPVLAAGGGLIIDQGVTTTRLTYRPLEVNGLVTLNEDGSIRNSRAVGSTDLRVEHGRGSAGWNSASATSAALKLGAAGGVSHDGGADKTSVVVGPKIGADAQMIRTLARGHGIGIRGNFDYIHNLGKDVQ